MVFPDKTPLLCLITKGEATDANFRAKSSEILVAVEKAVRAEISLIQIREKLLTAGKLFELAARAALITENSQTKLLVNDRADVARAAGADGVHLTARSLEAEIIRRTFGARFIIGVSAHSSSDLEAHSAAADFATFSPIFATASKAVYGAPQGVAKLREVSETFPEFPIIALGGIDETNFAEALRAGANGIAAIRLFNDAKNLPEIVNKIRAYENE